MGFDDYGGEIELHSLELTDSPSSSNTIIGKARAKYSFDSRFLQI
jgi:hypothetical protein